MSTSASRASQTADRATEFYSTARQNPYVQKLIEDEELRDSLKNAFEAARGAYSRATGNGHSPVKAVTSDKKVQKDLRSAAENLREASERLQAPKKKKKSRLGRLILFAIVAGVVALVVSEDARKTVLDALFGAEEEFEYTSASSINGA
jgi:multidrug resistance efflux pump